MHAYYNITIFVQTAEEIARPKSKTPPKYKIYKLWTFAVMQLIYMYPCKTLFDRITNGIIADNHLTNWFKNMQRWILINGMQNWTDYLEQDAIETQLMCLWRSTHACALTMRSVEYLCTSFCMVRFFSQKGKLTVEFDATKSHNFF